MDFKSKYLKPALSFFATHVISLVFCFILFIGFGKMFSSPGTSLIGAMILLIVYIMVIYPNAWALGNGDINKENYGRIQKDVYKGFKVGLVASIPNYLVTIVFVISECFNLFEISFLYRICNTHLLPFIVMVNTQTSYTALQLVLLVLFTLFTPICAGVFYIMGNRDFSPMQKIMYKKKPAPSTTARPSRSAKSAKSARAKKK